MVENRLTRYRLAPANQKRCMHSRGASSEAFSRGGERHQRHYGQQDERKAADRQREWSPARDDIKLERCGVDRCVSKGDSMLNTLGASGSRLR